MGTEIGRRRLPSLATRDLDGVEVALPDDDLPGPSDLVVLGGPGDRPRLESARGWIDGGMAGAIPRPDLRPTR